MSGLPSISVTSTQLYASVGTQSQQSLQPFANLDLTEAQRKSLRAIFTNAKKTGESQADVTKPVDAVLTPAQQQTLAGQAPPPSAGQAPPPFADLNLTTAQSASIKSILANAKSTGESQADVQKQINAILTTAQQQTLAADIKTAPPPPPATAISGSTADASSSDSSFYDSSSSNASSSSSTAAISTDGTILATVTNIQN